MFAENVVLSWVSFVVQPELCHFGSREGSLQLREAPPAEVAECRLPWGYAGEQNRRSPRAQSLKEAQHRAHWPSDARDLSQVQ